MTMKKILAMLCMTVLMVSVPAAVLAETQEDEGVVVSETTEYQEDGSYIEIVVRELPAVTRATTSKSGSKTYTGKTSDGEALWSFTVKGTFSVNTGVSATCTAASCSASIKNSNWTNTAKSVKKSGNQAIGNATFEKKLLGLITTESKTCKLVLTCDKNGKLS